MKLVIDGNGKLGHITGEVKKLAVKDPSRQTWRSENSMVIVWLINSTDPQMGKPDLFLPTTKEVWDAVRNTLIWKSHLRFLS